MFSPVSQQRRFFLRWVIYCKQECLLPW